MAGVYIHIPFCQKKCLYCDFYSVVDSRQIDGYIHAVQIEAEKRCYELREQEVKTVYLGGGTPSLVNYRLIGELLTTLRKYYNISTDAEITMECNPGDVSQMEVGKLVEIGINRFSIGVQTFNDKLLKTLGRRHNSEEVFELFNAMRAEGVENISLDLIYSIPGSTIADLEQDLLQMIALSPEHISTYDLIYEPTTPFYEYRKKGLIDPITEEVSLEMDHSICRLLRLAGYEHYEISNYAKKGYRSQHNSNYWKGVPYVGLGPSAHSYVHPWRSFNQPSLESYMKEILYGAQFVHRTFEKLTNEMQLEEYILTRLRTIEGISQSGIERLGYRFPSKTIDEMVQKGYLSHLDQRYALTDKGLDMADRVILELVNSIV